MSIKNRPGARVVGPDRRPQSTWTFLAIVGLALALCALMKVSTLYYPGDEPDEQIYWQLAVNLAHGGRYSLQGTELLSSLSPGIYDHPLFHHPPLFPVLLVPFVLLGAKSAAVTVSWLGHMLAVVAVALVGRHALRSRTDAASGLTNPIFWLPLLGVCADPLLVSVSRKLWTDGILAGLVALSVAVFLIADGRRRALLAVSGTLLGLAALAKLTALFVVPIYAVALFRRDLTWRSRLISLAAVALPVGLLVVPWCVEFYLQCGVFVPPWVKPDAWLIDRYPFVQVLVNRPWYYYALKLPLLMPLVAVCLWALVWHRKACRDRRVLLVTAWFFVILVAMTVLGVDGYGFQMRHMAPAVTALYMLVTILLAQEDRPILLMSSAFAILIGTVTGSLYLLLPKIDEMLSLVEISRVIRF